MLIWATSQGEQYRCNVHRLLCFPKALPEESLLTCLMDVKHASDKALEKGLYATNK